MPDYLRPTALDDALAALHRRSLTVLAGGTDFYPARVGAPLDDDVLDITALQSMRTIEEHADHWRIPALATWTDLVKADLPHWFDGLKLAAREIGGRQVQNAGTLCGNLCNASPAADGVPVLLSLDAEVELASAERRETMSLAAFIRGNRATALAPDQLMVAVRVPKPRAERARGHFLKLGRAALPGDLHRHGRRGAGGRRGGPDRPRGGFGGRLLAGSPNAFPRWSRRSSAAPATRPCATP